MTGKRQVDPDAMPDYRSPWQESLRAITAPLLLILGEPARGGLVTAEIADEAMGLNPNITTILIPDAGHNIRRENFDGYLAAVRVFLAGNQAVSRDPAQPKRRSGDMISDNGTWAQVTGVNLRS